MATTFSLQTYQSPSETLINDHISEEKKNLHFSQTTAGSFLFLDSATDLVIYTQQPGESPLER